MTTKSGALLSAIFASISCIAPLLAATTGIVGLNGLSTLAGYRPYFIGLAGLALVYSAFTVFMEKYRARDSRPQMAPLGKEEMVLSATTLAVLLVIFLPYVKAACPAATALTYEGSGGVIEVSQNKGGITLNQEEIRGLLPAMTMEYSVASPSLLRGISAGDRVRFRLSRQGSEFVVVAISHEKKP